MARKTKMNSHPKTSSYLPAQELLAKYPGRIFNINSSLAACYVRCGLPVPSSLQKVMESDRFETSHREENDGN